MPDVNAIVEGLRTEFKNLAILVERLMTKQEETEKKLDIGILINGKIT